MKFNFLFLIVIFVLCSCQSKPSNTQEEVVDKPNASVKKNHVFTDRVKFEFREEVEQWDSYWSLSDFMGRFKKVSANEVLSNAIELEGIVKQLKDSMKPSLLSSPAMNARINVLYNETLRLSDMTEIRAITAEEVNEQTAKVVRAFSSLNAKINAVLLKKKFQDDINVKDNFVGLDTTKMDSISRKSIREVKYKRPDQE